MTGKALSLSHTHHTPRHPYTLSRTNSHCTHTPALQASQGRYRLPGMTSKASSLLSPPLVESEVHLDVSVLQCVVACCSVLQCAAVSCHGKTLGALSLQLRPLFDSDTATHYHTLQHTITHCNALQQLRPLIESEIRLDVIVLLCVACVAVCGSARQCVAVCGSVWQCVLVCGSVWQCVAVCGSVWQCVAMCGSVLQCVAVCGSVWQCVAVYGSA